MRAVVSRRLPEGLLRRVEEVRLDVVYCYWPDPARKKGHFVYGGLTDDGVRAGPLTEAQIEDPEGTAYAPLGTFPHREGGKS